jgi:DinB superfamily
VQALHLPPFDWDAPSSLQDLLNDVLAIQRFPDELARVLKDVNDQNRTCSYRAGGWSINQLVHHLADAHMNAYIRTKHMVTGDAERIQPFDHEAWALTPENAFPLESSVIILLGVHQRWSGLLLECLKQPADLLPRSMLHPESGRTLTVVDMIRLYAWHGNHHLLQISHAIAFPVGTDA